MSTMYLIFGPTGVGKSSFADLFAHTLGYEIINCDTCQMYQPIPIGTAQPLGIEQSVPHHLYGCISSPQSINVYTYLHDYAIPKAKELTAHHKKVLFVGGAPFYIRSFFFPPQAKVSSKDDIKVLPEMCTWENLHAIDPKRAQKIHPADIFRIEQALKIYFQTGALPSSQEPLWNPVFDLVGIWVTMDRTLLLERIARRIKNSLPLWIDECGALSAEWKNFVTQEKKILGYQDIFEYLEGKRSRENLIETLINKTARYAKHQQTFNKRLVLQLQQQGARVEVIDAAAKSFDVYLKRIRDV